MLQSKMYDVRVDTFQKTYNVNTPPTSISLDKLDCRRSNAMLHLNVKFTVFVWKH